MKKSFPWELIAFALALGLAVWWLLIKDQHDPGVSLWVGLGFPYGPSGNLTSLQGQFKTGANRFDGMNALPVTQSPTNMLTDLLGNPLLDLAGNVLYDLNGPINVFPTRNAAAISDTYDPSGSRPS